MFADAHISSLGYLWLFPKRELKINPVSYPTKESLLRNTEWIDPKLYRLCADTNIHIE